MKSPFPSLLPHGLIFLVPLVLILFLSVPNTYSAQVTLAWEPNTEPDLAGYRLFCREQGQSYNYDVPVWQGTAITCTIPDLDDDTKYCFVVRAFDSSQNESGDSNEACWEHSASPPVLENLSITGPDSVNESGTANYKAWAWFSGEDKPQEATNSSDWSVSPDTHASVSYGQITTSAVSSDQTVTITATYTFQDVTKTAQKVVTIVDVSPSLVSLSISGPNSVNENSMAGYTATATFSDGSSQPATNSAIWSENSSYASISGGGVLTTSTVLTNQTVTITASYIFDSVTRTAQKVVTIVDIGGGDDSDSDGIPDWWEITHFGDLSHSGTAHTDNDRLTDLEEFQNDTNPNNPDTDGDGFWDGVEIDSGFDPTDPESKPLLPPLEIGEVSVDHNWKRVEFSETFQDPVVVAKSLSCNEGDPAVVRIRNADATGFEIRVQEWDYLGGIHAEETVGYIVMERGTHTLPDGTMVEAERFETDRTDSFGGVAFSRTFQVAPVVITAVSSYNEADAVTTRARNISINGFESRMREQELNSQTHVTESISYIAWEPSSGTMDDLTFEVKKTDDVMTHELQTIVCNETSMNIPVFLADMQTTDGGDTANLRWQNKDFYAVDVKVVEEQSSDSETSHTTEVVGYMLFSRIRLGPAEVIIDNGNAGTSSTGGWYVSSGIIPYGDNSLYSTYWGAKYTFE
ncbi:MAG: fibronectin type III domain-containing protein, partial [Deltaproteobacteria bacterium]|nr:fibronectin type III domain-containing protein [Deltaproteobacteria bacterium]